MKKNILLSFYLICFLPAFSQNIQRPKLVVGLVIDQMRWDYLYRYYDRYSAGGFKRLLENGFNCGNTFIPYTPTYTAAGHSCIYTGSVPALNGIMGNSWYNRAQKKTVYCTDDSSARAVGSSSSAGRMSPRNLWSNTIGDELRLATNFRSKTISIALKDRGSILPGGHAANASYWFDNATGGWISSTYYMKELPAWMKKLNDRKRPDAYLKENWNTLYPINTYVQSTSDSNAYEGRLPGEDRSFPHITSNITHNQYETFRHMPGGNSFTFETARAAIEGEQLGSRGITDFLALSCSSPDHIGHTFGPNSIEIEDTYLRLDRDIAQFLTYLDNKIGKGQYLLFLSADHASAQNAAFLRDHNLPAGSFDHNAVRRRISDSLEKHFQIRGIIAHTINYQIYLDDSVIRQNKLDKQAVKQFLINFIIRHPAVSRVVDLEMMTQIPLPQKLKTMLVNGYNQKLSGDLQIILTPQWFENAQSGTTHGQWNPYDAHIPLIWFGWKIKKGQLNREVYMTDIAPTLAALLHVQMPNACVGNVIEEVVGNTK